MSQPRRLSRRSSGNSINSGSRWMDAAAMAASAAAVQNDAASLDGTIALPAQQPVTGVNSTRRAERRGPMRLPPVHTRTQSNQHDTALGTDSSSQPSVDGSGRAIASPSIPSLAASLPASSPHDIPHSGDSSFMSPDAATAAAATLSSDNEEPDPTNYPIWIPPHPTSAVFSKTNLLAGKSHRNRLRESQLYLSAQFLDWSRVLLARNIIAQDIFEAMQNGEPLCMLVNRVCRPSTPLTVHVGAAIRSDEARQHVGSFLRVCSLLGVQHKNLFKPVDLIKGTNQRRVMRCLLYFSLALMQYGVLPPQALHEKVRSVCNKTGYALPEVLQLGKHALGSVGRGYVKSAAGASGVWTKRGSWAAVPAGSNRSSVSQNGTADGDRPLMIGVRRTDTSIAESPAGHAAVHHGSSTTPPNPGQSASSSPPPSIEFRPKLHFLGSRPKVARPPAPLPLNGRNGAASGLSGGGSFKPQVPHHQTNASTSSLSSISSTSSSSPDAKQRFTFGEDATKDLPPPPSSLQSSFTHTHTSIGATTPTDTQLAFPPFPHPDGHRFESALQQLDLSDLLHSATDETDVDAPTMAALLFPTFAEGFGVNIDGENKPDHGDDDGSTSALANRIMGSATSTSKGAGAWNRHSATLHHRINPLKIGLWSSRHPWKMLLFFLWLWLLSILLLFAPYPDGAPFRIDFTPNAFSAGGAREASQRSIEAASGYSYEDLLDAQKARLEENVLFMGRRGAAGAGARFEADVLLSTSTSASSSSDILEHADKQHDILKHISRHLLRTANHSIPRKHERWRASVAMQRHLLQADPDAPLDRTSSGMSLSIYFLTSDGVSSSLLDAPLIDSIRSFEVSLLTRDVFAQLCLRNDTPSNGIGVGLNLDGNTATSNVADADVLARHDEHGRILGCRLPDSALNYFYPRLHKDSSAHPTFMSLDGTSRIQLDQDTIVPLLLQWDRKGFFDANFDQLLQQQEQDSTSTPSSSSPPTKLQTRYLYLGLSFGLPLPPNIDGGDSIPTDQQSDYLRQKVLDEYVPLSNGMTLSNGAVHIAVDGPGVQGYILRQILVNHDLLLVMGSIAAVALYGTCHFRSLSLVLGLLFQSLISLFISAAIYRTIFRIDEINTLHVIALFVVLALGTNDAFVLWDTFYHSSLLLLRVELPLDRMLRKSREREKAYAERQSDGSWRGYVSRWYHDWSGLGGWVRSCKQSMPWYSEMTDEELQETFRIGIQYSDPLAVAASRMGLPRAAAGGGAALSSLFGGSGQAPATSNTAATGNRGQTTTTTTRPRTRRLRRMPTYSRTPTRLEEESEGEDMDADERAWHAAMHDEPSVVMATPNNASMTNYELPPDTQPPTETSPHNQIKPDASNDAPSAAVASSPSGTGNGNGAVALRIETQLDDDGGPHPISIPIPTIADVEASSPEGADEVSVPVPLPSFSPLAPPNRRHPLQSPSNRTAIASGQTMMGRSPAPSPKSHRLTMAAENMDFSALNHQSNQQTQHGLAYRPGENMQATSAASNLNTHGAISSPPPHPPVSSPSSPSSSSTLGYNRRHQIQSVIAALDDLPAEEADEEASNLTAMSTRGLDQDHAIRAALRRSKANRLALRISWTIKRAAPSLLQTDLTIIVALYAIGWSDLPGIRHFGVFIGTVALINMLLSLTFFPTLLVVQSLYLSACHVFPKCFWKWWKRTMEEFDAWLNAGQEKYDRAVRGESVVPKRGSDISEGGIEMTTQPHRPTPSRDGIGGRSMSKDNGSSDVLTLPTPRQVLVRGTSWPSTDPRHHHHHHRRQGSADMDLSPSSPSSTHDMDSMDYLPHIRGGVNITKDDPDEAEEKERVRRLEAQQQQQHQQQQQNGGTETNNQMTREGTREMMRRREMRGSIRDDGDNASDNRVNRHHGNIGQPKSPPVAGQLVKSGLAADSVGPLTADRAKCLSSFDKSQRNHFLVFLNASLFRFRRGLLIAWSCILIWAFAQAVQFRVPSNGNDLISILPPSDTHSNLALLQKVYTNIPRCSGCTYEFDRMEHQILPLSASSTLPITNDAQSIIQAASDPTSSDATVLPLARQNQKHKQLEVLLSSKASPGPMPIHHRSPSITNNFSPNPHLLDAAATFTPWNMIKEYEVEQQAKMDMLTRRPSRRLLSDESTELMDVPSAPPLLAVSSIGYNSFRLTFAQSLYAGSDEIESYTARIVPVDEDGASDSASSITSNIFTSTPPSTCLNIGARVSLMIVGIQVEKPQSTLPSLRFCSPLANVTECSPSSLMMPTASAALPPSVTLPPSWFSTVIIEGGSDHAGLTYTSAGTLQHDLRGLVHNQRYNLSMSATSKSGTSAPSYSVQFTTLDGTPSPPILKSVTWFVPDPAIVDDEEDMDGNREMVRFGCNITIQFSTPPHTIPLPQPTHVNIYWESNDASANNIPLPPERNAGEHATISLEDLSCGEFDDWSNCNLPTFFTSQLRGDTNIQMWATISNRHATSAHSQTVDLHVPTAPPHAPIIAGYALYPDPTAVTPRLRLFFHVPAVNHDGSIPSASSGTGVQLEYSYVISTNGVDSGSSSSTTMQESTVKNWVMSAVADASFEIQPVLFLPSGEAAPIYYVDFNRSSHGGFVSIEPNALYMLQLKVVDGSMSGARSSSSYIVTPPLIIDPPSFTDLAFDGSTLTISWSVPPAPLPSDPLYFDLALSAGVPNTTPQPMEGSNPPMTLFPSPITHLTFSSHDIHGLNLGMRYYVVVKARTSYASSEKSNIECFQIPAAGESITSASAHPLSPDQSVAQCAPSVTNSLCIGTYDGLMKTCHTGVRRESITDEMLIYERLSRTSTTPSSDTSADSTQVEPVTPTTLRRRFLLSTPLQSMFTTVTSIRTLVLTPLEPLLLVDSPAAPKGGSCVNASNPATSADRQMDARCLVPCLSTSSASSCSASNAAVPNLCSLIQASILVAPSQSSSPSTTFPIDLLAGLPSPTRPAPQLIVDVAPYGVDGNVSLPPGIYSCGINIDALIVDESGGVVNRLSPDIPADISDSQPGMDGQNAPFDIILTLKVLEQPYPQPVRNLSYIPLDTNHALIMLSVPASPASDPICALNLRYTNSSSGFTTHHDLWLTTPTATTGFVLQAVWPNVDHSSTSNVHFTIRALNSHGAADFESYRFMEECTNDESEGGLQACNGRGRCRTTSYVQRQVNLGTNWSQLMDGSHSDAMAPTYTILSSLLSHDVVSSGVGSDQSFDVYGSSRCICSTDSSSTHYFGPRCTSQCPTGIPPTSPSMPESTCSSMGSCDVSSGVCTCVDGYGGPACDVFCSGCADRGFCSLDPSHPDRGVHCQCFPQWGGDHCQQSCPIDANTQLTCAGHGWCDANVKCACHTQWRGEICQYQCPGSVTAPNGTLLECNGRGRCEEDENGARCVCDNSADTTSDCSLIILSSGESLRNVHYDLPTYASLSSIPIDSLPAIRLVWGVDGVSGGSSSSSGSTSDSSTAEDYIGEGGSQTISLETSNAAGTPIWSQSFDPTQTNSQEFLRAICELFPGSGLMHPNATSCMFTAFEQFVLETAQAGGGVSIGGPPVTSFPVPPFQFMRTFVRFLQTLTDERQKMWRQHVGFLFSDRPFHSMSKPKHLADTDTLSDLRRMSSPPSHSNDGNWLTSLFHRTSQSSESFSSATHSSSPSGSLFLRFDELDELLHHPMHGQEFSIHFHGEPFYMRAHHVSPAQSSSSSKHGFETEARQAGSTRIHPLANTPATAYVRVCFISFQTILPFPATSSNADMQSSYASAWDDFVSTHINPVAPSSIGAAFHASDVWISLARHDAFSEGIVASFIVLYMFIWICILIGSGWDLRLAAVVTLSSIGLFLLCFGLFYQSDMSLGIVEFILAQIIIALGMHPLLYLGRAYAISPFRSRFGRARHALIEWGPSIISAFIAMFLSNFALMFATISVLSTAGSMLALMSVVSLLFILTFYIPLLQSAGPVAQDPNGQTLTARKAARRVAEKKVAQAAAAAIQAKRNSAQPQQLQSLTSFLNEAAADPSLAGSNHQPSIERNRPISNTDANANANDAKPVSPSLALRGGAGFGALDTGSSPAASTSSPVPPSAPVPSNAGTAVNTAAASVAPVTDSDQGATNNPTTVTGTAPMPFHPSDLSSVKARPARHSRSDAAMRAPNPLANLSGAIHASNTAADDGKSDNIAMFDSSEEDDEDGSAFSADAMGKTDSAGGQRQATASRVEVPTTTSATTAGSVQRQPAAKPTPIPQSSVAPPKPLKPTNFNDWDEAPLDQQETPQQSALSVNGGRSARSILSPQHDRAPSRPLPLIQSSSPSIKPVPPQPAESLPSNPASSYDWDDDDDDDDDDDNGDVKPSPPIPPPRPTRTSFSQPAPPSLPPPLSLAAAPLPPLTKAKPLLSPLAGSRALGSRPLPAPPARLSQSSLPLPLPSRLPAATLAAVALPSASRAASSSGALGVLQGRGSTVRKGNAQNEQEDDDDDDMELDISTNHARAQHGKSRLSNFDDDDDDAEIEWD